MLGKPILEQLPIRIQTTIYDLPTMPIPLLPKPIQLLLRSGKNMHEMPMWIMSKKVALGTECKK